MGIFKKKELKTVEIEKGIPIEIKEKRYYVQEAVYDYIRELERENIFLKGELNTIKPVIESKAFKPALSEDCAKCKYVVRNRWNNSVIGCCKDNVCEDFYAEDNDNND